MLSKTLFVCVGVATATSLSTLMGGNAAQAATFTVNGLTFSEQTGAFTIDNVTGSGTELDPFVIEETVTGLDVTMLIEGLAQFSGTVGGRPGFFLQKIVTNNTGEIWDFFDHELQETLGIPSSEGDGLSFAQGLASVRPFTSDKFSDVDEVTNVRDFINFSNGMVNPGETVTFNYAITDNSPNDFYLRQRPNFDPAVPEPTSVLSLLGLASLGIGSRLRRKQA